MPKQITQAELQACLEQNAAVNRRMLDIRSRITKGATVEPGELSAEAETEEPDYDAFAPGLGSMGLNIIPTADFLASQRLRRKCQDQDAAERRSKIVLIHGGNREMAHA